MVRADSEPSQNIKHFYFLILIIKNYYKKKAVEATKQKEEKRKKPKSPRNRKACHSISTALLKSLAEIGTQSAMKSRRKTLHEFTSHIPQKTPKRNKSRLLFRAILYIILKS
jgi:hypothetical protein